mmetsp:Transcript_22519/g.34816  ORF Transcript_22519/g.34816 Transcript_22519/m.34816 type:complete len:110 (+) Transcript_22519:2172-2501(+)
MPLTMQSKQGSRSPATVTQPKMISFNANSYEDKISESKDEQVSPLKKNEGDGPSEVSLIQIFKEEHQPKENVSDFDVKGTPLAGSPKADEKYRTFTSKFQSIYDEKSVP